MKTRIFKIRKTSKNIGMSWTIEEDKELLNCVKLITKRIKWNKIAKMIGNSKTGFQCFKRYKSINTSYKKGRWSKEEDIQLTLMVNFFGRSWNMIAKIMKNRSNKQIKSRYDEYIRPDLIKTPFSKEEDLLILELYNKFSNQWAKFQKYMPNRSQRKIKLRYEALLNTSFYKFYSNLSQIKNSENPLI